MNFFSKLPILLAFLALNFSQNSIAQSYNNFYGGIVSNCSIDTLQTNLLEFESFGVKEVGTTANANALNWLINKYTSFGYTDIEIDTFTYSSNFAYNLIVTKIGTRYPNTFVIIDGHYDTKNGLGANDNGSGISIILETARLLKDIDTEFSVKFINFSAEEVGLVGSFHYVNNVVVPQNLDIKILLNIDEVGGVNGEINNTIVCERDENNNPSTNNVASANYTDTLARCMQLYSNLFTTISYAYSSDYMPFQSAGKIITGLFEENQSPYTHTVNDVFANLDMNYVFEVAKGTVGSSLYYAVAYDSTISINEFNQKDFELYPNPATDFITIKFNPEKNSKGNLKIVNLLGEVVYENNINEPTTIISLNHFTSGIYHLIVESDKFIQTQKFMVR
jgi:hypothetical protein